MSGQIVAMSMDAIFDAMFGDIKPTKGRPYKEGNTPYPFPIRCGIPHSAPRHERWEYLLTLGSGMLDDILLRRNVRAKSLVFVFPERYLGVPETHRFVSDLKHNPNANNFTDVTIITHSPMIVGNFGREQVAIISFDPPDPW